MANLVYGGSSTPMASYPAATAATPQNPQYDYLASGSTDPNVLANRYGLPTNDAYGAAYNNAQTPGSANQVYNSGVAAGVMAGPQNIAGGNVLGMAAFNPSYMGGTAMSVGGGGSGAGGTTSLANQQKKLIDQRKGGLIQGAEERYQGNLADLARSEQLFRGETQQNRDYVGQQRDIAMEGAKKSAEDATRAARQNYLDSIVSNRRRIRATGAGSSSGAMELFNMLDRDFNSGLQSIEGQKMGTIGSIQLTAQKTLSDLENSLNKFIADIESQKEMSLREKNDAVREAEFAAADAALNVDKWVSDRMASSSGSSSRAAASQQQANMIASFTRDLQANPNSQQEVMQAYAPMFAQAGINPSDAMAYSSFGQAQSPSFLQQYTGLTGASDEDIKYLLDYGNAQSNNYLKNMTGYVDLLGQPIASTQKDKIASTLYPDLYQQFAQ